uniref:Nucleolar protein 11 n=1 Tax=Petromyzon marinus TaxID=7757 RepID=S4RY59_PETMA
MALLQEPLTVSTLRLGPRELLGAASCGPPGAPGLALLTRSPRSVSLVKVSEQKPLGTWSLRQGQSITGPAIYNPLTAEYILVQDKKTLRIWKDEDVNLDKVFKATASAEIHSLVPGVCGGEPAVLFEGGAVLPLDVLLSAPQQPVEASLPQGEVIRYCMSVGDEQTKLVAYLSEKDEVFTFHVHSLNSSAKRKLLLQQGYSGARPLAHDVSLQQGRVQLTSLCSDGGLYRAEVPLVFAGDDDQTGVMTTDLLMKLPAFEVVSEVVSLAMLDASHVVVAGVRHPYELSVKGALCVWNTQFHTLQDWKSLPGSETACGQLWRVSDQLFLVHGKTLLVSKFTCEPTCLALVPGGFPIRHQTKPDTGQLVHAACEGRATKDCGVCTSSCPQPKRSRKSQAMAQKEPVTAESVLSLMQDGSDDEICAALESVLCSCPAPDVAALAGRLARELAAAATTAAAARSHDADSFHPRRSLVCLASTGALSHSACPGVLSLALERRDFSLLQKCLFAFPDTPEALLITSLKAILGLSDSELEACTVDVLGVTGCLAQVEGACMQIITASFGRDFSPPTTGQCDSFQAARGSKTARHIQGSCGNQTLQSVNRLGNAVLCSAFSDNFMLPYLKDLQAEHVVRLLQYLQFLLNQCSQTKDGRLGNADPVTLNQVLQWISLLLDAHFTMLLLTPQAKPLLHTMHKFAITQVRLCGELSKMAGVLESFKKRGTRDMSDLYSIEVLCL